MKKRLLLSAIAISCALIWLTPANATLVGEDLVSGWPDIHSNQTGIYTYTWDSNTNQGLFTARATPITISYDGVTLQNIGGTRSYDVSFYVDGSGNFVSGVGGDDLRIVGNSNVLLTGEVTGFGWEHISKTRISLFDFTFDVTGGTLASKFSAGLGYDLALTENSDFGGDWKINHDGMKVKHDTSPVPIPATIWLLGAGLVGLVTLKRRKL